MLGTRPPQRPAIFTLLAVGVAMLVVSVQVMSVEGATGPSPTAPVTIQVSPVENLGDADTVTYNVTSTGPGIFSVDVHTCETGHAVETYNDANFGFAGGERCINTPFIVAGGLTGAQYEQADVFDGATLTSGDQTITVGTGHVEWFNNDGFPGSPMDGDGITCGVASLCDLVFRVSLNGGGNIYFVQTLAFGESLPGTTTTTTSTTTPSSTTTTTAPGSTTTTTAPQEPHTLTPDSGPAGSTFTVRSEGWPGNVEVDVRFEELDQEELEQAGAGLASVREVPATDGDVSDATIDEATIDEAVGIASPGDSFFLGSAESDSDGLVTGPFDVPDAVPPGIHAVVIAGLISSDQVRLVILPFTVEETPATTTTTAPTASTTPVVPLVSAGGATAGSGGTSGQLAFAGASSRDLASIGVLIIAIGIHLLAVRRRRLATP